MAKLLIAIPSPRDIEQFAEATAKITKYDKYWVKYYYEQEAYDEIRRYFLEHGEYTHLAILADDLIIKEQDVDRLFAMRGNCPVICGVAMVNRERSFDGLLSIGTVDVPSIIRSGRTYNLMNMAKYDSYGQLKPIIQVMYQGFPLPIIRRDVVEAIRFRDDREPNHRERGCCLDLMFSYDCAQQGIPMYCDLNVFMDHLPGKEARFMNFGAGTKTPYTKLEQATI